MKDKLKPEELRIGNLILMNSEICRVYQLDHKYKTVYEINDIKIDTRTIEDYYKPIPITEQWLLNFRFISMNYDYITNPSVENEEDIIVVNKKYYCLNTDEGWYFRIEDSILTIGGFRSMMVKLKGIHQLQNLVFALTGEEITMKTLNK